MNRALRYYLLGIAAPAAAVLVLILGLPRAPFDPVLAAILVAIGVVAANFPVMIRKNYKVDATPAIDLALVVLFPAAAAVALVGLTRLLGDATDALLRWQLATRPGELPPYDEALLRREMNLFPEWYVSRHLGVELSNAQKSELEGIFRLLVKSALAQSAVYVHRDYMPRNLMVSDPNPGVLDFQDAVLGPITYDMVSLLRDAFVSWDEERVLDWSVRYWEKAKRAGLPVETGFAEFWRAFEWMGLQRHLKVLGIFARINYRDGKPKYLEDTPRFIRYARAVSERYAALAPLARLLDELE